MSVFVEDAAESVASSDVEVVESARGVAGRLQAVAASLRGVPIDLEKLRQQTYYYAAGYTSGSWWRLPSTSWAVTTNIPEMRAKMEKVVADPANPKRLAPAIQGEKGDNLHPNGPGETAMGEAIDLRLFR